MTMYKEMAYVYDRLMDDAPYLQWLTWTERVVQGYLPSARSLVDLGCGTGTLTIALAKNYSATIGIDLSEEMLFVAAQKETPPGTKVEWIQQDMTQLALPEKVDVIMCTCDSLNYVIEEGEVEAMFEKAYQNLNDGGLLLFDFHTLHKMAVGFGRNTFVTNTEEVAYIWDCYFDQSTHIIGHELTFFVQQSNGLYKRFDESHRQRAYAQNSLIDWLKQTGFTVQEITADFTLNPPREDSDRVFVVAQKK